MRYTIIEEDDCYNIYYADTAPPENSGPRANDAENRPGHPAAVEAIVVQALLENKIPVWWVREFINQGKIYHTTGFQLTTH